MNLKLILAFILTFFGASLFGSVFAQSSNSIMYGPPANAGDYLEIISNTERSKQTIRLPVDQLLFNVIPHYDQNSNLISLSMQLKPNLTDTYQEIGLFDKPKDIVFVYPIFTQAAYGTNGFYDYYNKKCDTSCLTVSIPAKINGVQASSIAGAWALKLLQFPFVTDEDIDKNPDILKQYKRVIILHSEYVTKKEFDAITSHQDVIFLYPNALYAEVKTDYDNNTITLIRGHGYPDPNITNGFDWKGDNSKYEYNVQCDKWNFYKKDNATMLNCYPEYKMLYSAELLKSLQRSDPTDLLDDVANWLRYPNQGIYTSDVLDEYDISGSHIPSWVSKSAIMLTNGDITRNDFANIIQYLNTIHALK
ncbi:MAG: hypothetical protein KGI05_05065 [Thaumarchaeota archaeon]|nr:hypothetical protein [Nitrososphaerota archaeon]